MPTLVLIRHAKAEAHRPEDHGRRLAERGRMQCQEVRSWLTQHDLAPDRVVVSTAARTRETWELCSTGTATPLYDDRVYEASPEDLRDVIAETPASTSVLALVGHNPSIERLAWELDDSEDARKHTENGLGTAGIAVFSLDSWGATFGTLKEIRPRTHA